VLLFGIEARQQRVERIGLDEVAAPRGLHRVDGLVIRYQRLDGLVQRMLLDFQVPRRRMKSRAAWALSAAWVAATW
jgi:hypothetical protein